jgi:hypothetical protein
MDNELIDQRQAELKVQFEQLQQQLTAKREELANGEDELKRLQGRYAELEDLKQKVQLEISDNTPVATILEVETEQEEKPDDEHEG